jgi:hypothetical protein
MNGRWQDVLSSEEIERYELKAKKRLGGECAEWLAAGVMPGDQTASE